MSMDYSEAYYFKIMLMAGLVDEYENCLDKYLASNAF